MTRPLLLAPSMLAADGGRLAQEAQDMERAGADWLHLDVMDGHFVPNLTFGPSLVGAMVRATKLYCDAHLMVANPHQWLKPFADAGVHNITVHAEAAKDLPGLLGAITRLGCHAGVSINPTSPHKLIEDVLHQVQTVLVMSVQPGFGGQKYQAQTNERLQLLSGLRAQRGLNFHLEVDGGINASTIAQAYQAGADVCVAGTALFGQRNYTQAVTDLRQAALANT